MVRRSQVGLPILFMALFVGVGWLIAVPSWESFGKGLGLGLSMIGFPAFVIAKRVVRPSVAVGIALTVTFLQIGAVILVSLSRAQLA